MMLELTWYDMYSLRCNHRMASWKRDRVLNFAQDSHSVVDYGRYELERSFHYLYVGKNSCLFTGTHEFLFIYWNTTQ